MIAIGARCSVTFPLAMDKQRMAPAVRVGRIETIYPDGRLAVRLPWGEIVCADPSQVEVFP
jgi:hypothetical protein